MTLTAREKAAVEHLTELAVGFSVAAKAYDMRQADAAGNRSELALMHRSKVSGLIIAIAVIRGITTSEVQNEIEAAVDS